MTKTFINILFTAQLERVKYIPQRGSAEPASFFVEGRQELLGQRTHFGQLVHYYACSRLIATTMVFITFLMRQGKNVGVSCPRLWPHGLLPPTFITLH